MPVWAWVIVIVCVGVVLLAAILWIARGTHRLRAQEPLHGDPTNFGATVPMHVSAADSLTSRELEAEHGRAEKGERLGGTPTPGQRSS